MKKFLKILAFCFVGFVSIYILYNLVCYDEDEVTITVSQNLRKIGNNVENESDDNTSGINEDLNSDVDPDKKNDKDKELGENKEEKKITEFAAKNDDQIENENVGHEEKITKIFNNVRNDNDDKEKKDLAIIICEVGFSTSVLKDFINDFDRNITIGINAAEKDRDYLKDIALQKKHEVFFVLPFEPIEFPDNNPGPLTILTGVTSDENIYKMNLLLGGADGVAGIINTIGTRFVISPQDMMPIMKFCERKNLIYVNAVNYENEIVNEILRSANAKYIMLNSLFDLNYATEESIKEELESLLNSLKNNGHAITLMFATVNVINVLKEWLEKNKKTVHLIRVSEYFNKYCK